METNQQKQPNLRAEYLYSEGSGAPEVPKPKLAAAINCYGRTPRKKTIMKQFQNKNLPQEGNQHAGESLPKPGCSKDSEGSKNSCHICGYKFTRANNLLAHFRNKHNLHFKCKQCENTFFKSKQELTTHKKKHHNKCLNCDKVFIKDFQHHIKTCEKKLYHKFILPNSEIISSTLKNCPLPIEWFVIHIYCKLCKLLLIRRVN